MNASQLRSKVPLGNSEAKADRDATEESDTTTDEQSGSLRRKLALGAAILGVGMYVRRRRSRNGEPETDRTADEDEIETEPVSEEPVETERDTEQPSKRGGNIGRRLKLLVVSTLLFTLAQRIVRRFRSSN